MRFKCVVILSGFLTILPTVQAAEQPNGHPTMRVLVDASIVPRPGEPITVRVEFDRPMDTAGSPSAELAFSGSPPQVLRDREPEKELAL